MEEQTERTSGPGSGSFAAEGFSSAEVAAAEETQTAAVKEPWTLHQASSAVKEQVLYIQAVH